MSQTMPQICESCLRLEVDIKKFKNDIGHMKQVENELRQKIDSHLTTKSCLQAKQKENEELEKKYFLIVIYYYFYEFKKFYSF